MQSPLLSVVTPTLGNFSDYWLEQLLAIQGNVQFILVYPPGTEAKSVCDSRVQVIYSSFRGETAQRLTGLLNASGQYLIALDDDDFLYPNVLRLTQNYFERFPQSWVLRLRKQSISHTNQQAIEQPWKDAPNIEQLKVLPRMDGNTLALQEIPIAPLNNRFNSWTAINPWTKRKDHHGAHIENFNNKVWKTQLVKESLSDLSQAMRVSDPLTWLPSWSLDRLLALYLQAKFFQQGLVIGHWLPNPPQVRYISKPQTLRSGRTMFAADALLAFNFPQYGYFWNLFFTELYNLLKTKTRELVPFQRGKS